MSNSQKVDISIIWKRIAKQDGTEQERLQMSSETETKSAFERAISGVNAFRIALGAVISMLLFQGIQAVQTFFKTAIDNARDYELTLYRLVQVEKTLSQEGIDVSVQGLKKGIQDIHKLLPIFSKEDIAEVVGGLGLATKELGFSETQLLNLSKAVLILNKNSTEAETALQTQQKLVSSLLTNNAKGVANLGVSFSKTKMEAKGAELGILKAGQAVSDLTDKQKGQIKLAIILDAAGLTDIETQLETIGKIMDTNDSKIEANKAAWNDLATSIGQVILPFLPTLTGIFTGIIDAVNLAKVALIEFLTIVGTVGVAITLAFTGQIKSVGQFTDFVKGLAANMREVWTNEFFKDVPENSPKWFMKGWGHLIKEEADTATAGIDNLGESIADLDTSKIQDIIDDAANAREDLAKKLSQKKDDLELRVST